MKTIYLYTINFIGAILCALVPLFVWFSNPELPQMQIFKNTWMWSFYSVIVFLIGTFFISMIENRKQK